MEYISSDNRDTAARWLKTVEAKYLLTGTQPNMGEAALRFGVDVRMKFVGRYINFHRHVTKL